MILRFIAFLLFGPLGLLCRGAEWPDSAEMEQYRFRPAQIALPATLISAGATVFAVKEVRQVNHSLRDKILEYRTGPATVDDFLQYTPIMATYGLKACGVTSRHDYADLSILSGTAYALMAVAVNVPKQLVRSMRPDGSAYNSFPSGHTATAFTGAELLRREYWRTSPWIGVAGYAAATATGILRMYNNRHWLTDVLAGAGVGILSVQAAYWLYPQISKIFYPSRQSDGATPAAVLAPWAGTSGAGLAAAFTF